jgi:hypothetical protein
MNFEREQGDIMNLRLINSFVLGGGVAATVGTREGTERELEKVWLCSLVYKFTESR